MAIISIILTGLVVGLIAKLIMPGRDPGGCLITIFLGIIGAFVANYLGRMLGFYREGETAGFFASIMGAVFLLILYRILVARRGPK
jgi:uncharacterized membrane protein YeaQ/YmgE (transglycosylase-associated protein family)